MDTKDVGKNARASAPTSETMTTLPERKKGDWKTKYPPEANRRIVAEAVYLFLIIICCVVLIIFFYSGKDMLSLYISAWVGGMIGGALYAVKWLYSSVKNMEWIEDMWIWRFFTPIISGALGFTVVLIILSEIFKFFEPGSVDSFEGSFVIGFLTGYVSDSAVKKIKELAETLFGTPKQAAAKTKKEEKKPPAG